MKKFSLLSLLFLVFNMATAQQEISTAYATAVNNMFAPLDKNRIPHKVLLTSFQNPNKNLTIKC